jgi:aminoglycoside 3'-phosphotransferase-1
VEATLSPELRGLVDGGAWLAVPGTSTATVWQVELEDGRSVFVKAGAEPGVAAAITDELARWEWLEATDLGQLPVPAVLGHQAADPGAHQPAAIVSAAAEGVPELHWFLDPPDVADLLGSTLRAVHALPVDRCPFEAAPSALIAAAEERVAAGLVDSSKFHAANQRYSPHELLGHARALVAADPDGADRVVVHGDFSVGNVIVRPDTRAVTGVVDWAGLGVGDRHLDLATAARSLVTHFGGECLPRFLAAYGFEEPDPLRLEFYSLLDQFR